MMERNPLRKERAIDIVFCIDATGDMAPHLENVKTAVKKFVQEYMTLMINEYDSIIQEMSTKIITFRDYAFDGKQAVIESEFFDVTEGCGKEFEDYLSGIVAEGGGGEEKNGLEALALAMKSDWKSIGMYDRQVIVLFTDADAHELGKMAGVPGYPADMVDMAGLINLWECGSAGKLRCRCKRLVMFAPAGTKYETLPRYLSRGVFVPTASSSDLEDLQIDYITCLWDCF